MAISLNTRRERRGPSEQVADLPAAGGARAALAPTLALTVTLAVACFTVLMAAGELLVDPEPRPPPFDLGQRQRLETALYLTAFAVILPAALILVPRRADAIAKTPNGRALPALAAVLAATLGASILAVRAMDGGVGAALAATGAWCIGAGLLVARAGRSGAWGPLLALGDRAPALWTLAAALTLGSLLSFASLRSISVPALLLGGAAIGTALMAWWRGAHRRLPRLGPRWGLAVDAALVAVVALAVPDLVIFDSTGPGGDPLAAFERSVIQFHHNFVLGPANEVLHGGAMLVDAASQYGVGSIYFLAGWFQLAPIGYGTFGFLDGALFAVLFAAAYCLLRIAGASRPLASAAMVVAAVVLIYNLPYSVGSLPAQHGPLRFGLPMVIVVAAAACARWPQRARAGLAVQLTAVGAASIWALEALAYSAGTFAGIAGFQAWIERGDGRSRRLARRAALALTACLAAHLVLVGATLAFAGQLPDYGWYLSFLRSFLFGEVGNITYDFPPWSPALALGAGYAASAAAVVLIVRRRRELVERERVALTALWAVTVYGIVLFSYFVDRSAAHILPYVSLPAVLAGGIWLSLLMRGALGGPRSVQLAGLAFALALAVLLTSVAWSSVGERFPRSALGLALPGGDSVRAARHALWDLPPLDGRAPQGESLLGRHMPGRERVLTLVAPDLEAEILIRSGRAHQLPFSYPTEDSFASSHYLPELRRTVAELREGDRLLTQLQALDALALLGTSPSRRSFTRAIAVSNLAPLQVSALQRIGERFRLRVLHRDDQGFVVAALAARR